MKLRIFYLSFAATAALAFPISSSLSNQVSNLRSAFRSPLLSPYLPGSMPSSEGGSSSDLMISDVLPRSRSINIFASLTRDVDPVSTRLDNQLQNSTILAPLNSAIQGMDHKPWEDSKDYDAFGTEQAYAMGEGEDRAHRNLGKWVQAHVVPISPWKEGDKVKTLADTEVWWENNGDGEKVVSSPMVLSRVSIQYSKQKTG